MREEGKIGRDEEWKDGSVSYMRHVLRTPVSHVVACLRHLLHVGITPIKNELGVTRWVVAVSTEESLTQADGRLCPISVRRRSRTWVAT